jgi:hypothetical protein
METNPFFTSYSSGNRFLIHIIYISGTTYCVHSHFFRVIEDASNSMRNEECIEFGGVLLRNRKTPSSKTSQLTFDDSIVDPFDAFVEDRRIEIKDLDGTGNEHGTPESQSDTHLLRQSRHLILFSQSYGIRR